MRRRQWLSACGCALGVGSGLGLFGAAQAAQLPLYSMPERLPKPDINSDEGGLWALMDREETKLKRSKLVIKDDALNDYIRSIVCSLGGAHCADVRVYVVRNPWFNANMAPNGMMQIWSGLLLRASNEAQLASVMGHEIGHYLARHSVQSLRDIKNRAAFGTFLGMFGAIGSLGGMAVLAGAYAYSRDNEREADMIGIDLMAKAGYAPSEAATVWGNLLAEIKADREANKDFTKSSVMFASHPPSEERQTDLKTRATTVLGSMNASQTGQDRYQKIVGPYRQQFAADDIKRRRFAESEALYQRMLLENPQDWDAHYFLGEVYRTRAESADWALALQSFETGERSAAPVAELFRAKGLVLRQLQRNQDAAAALTLYLEKKPDAEDAALIEQYIKESR